MFATVCAAKGGKVSDSRAVAWDVLRVLAQLEVALCARAQLPSSKQVCVFRGARKNERREAS